MKRRFQFIGIHFHHLREQTNATEMKKKKRKYAGRPTAKQRVIMDNSNGKCNFGLDFMNLILNPRFNKTEGVKKGGEDGFTWRNKENREN
jgi:hypothetical protein